MSVRSRFEKEMDEIALALTSSMDSDENIFIYDILVDYAHVLMLAKQGIISEKSAANIFRALKKIMEDGFDSLSKNYEDVHEAIEARVTEIAGKDGMWMHTGRSRNDEVATCLRMYARDRILQLLFTLLDLRSTLLRLAKKHKNDLMPGFTHLQYAQPTKLSHHLLAYHDMIARDFERFLKAFERTNLSPLGSSAFSGTSFNIDREMTARLLGFRGIVENSLDGVSSRDFLIECIFACSSLMLSLSRMCEELILWASEFDFIELPDEFSSSSSIMPQKKNPDVAELIRAKAGTLIGLLASAMAIYKAMPFAYNRDFQEMNSLLYSAFEIAILSSRVMAEMMDKVRFKTDVMEEKAGKGFSIATEIANLLTEKGIPFRISHKIVGELAKRENFSPKAEDVLEIARKFGFEVELSDDELENVSNSRMGVEKRKSAGGTSSENIERMIKSRVELLEKDEENLTRLKAEIDSAIEELWREVDAYEGKMG